MNQRLTLPPQPVRIQLCGRFSVVVDGTPCEDALPGRQGQRLFAYLVLYRQVHLERSQLVDAVWGSTPPKAADAALSALLSKLRGVLGDDSTTGRGVPAITLPAGTYVDVEHALDTVHRGETQLARGQFADAYTSAGARYIAERTFLDGHEGDWIDDWRRRMDDVLIRALAIDAEAALRLGGLELATADRASKQLIEKCPFRESAFALRMDVLEALGNTAEALLVYDELLRRLSDELGAGPGPELQVRHERLLRMT